MNPYQVFGVAKDAGDKEIRQAYLASVKKTPPETDSEAFAVLSGAYAAIKDERSRYEYELFNKECPGDSPIDALVRSARLKGPPRPLPKDQFIAFLRKCASASGGKGGIAGQRSR